MSFPSSPTNNQTYTNNLGTRYKYSSVNGAWNIDSQEIQGYTGAQGYTGVQGYTGAQGYTGVWGHTGADGGAYGTINAVIQSKTTTIEAGGSVDFEMPFNYKFTDWKMLGNETGTIYIKMYNGNYSTFPPTTLSHVGLTGPYILNGIKNSGNTSAWSGYTGSSGEIIRYYIDAASTMKRCTLSMTYQRI